MLLSCIASLTANYWTWHILWRRLWIKFSYFRWWAWRPWGYSRAWAGHEVCQGGLLELQSPVQPVGFWEVPTKASWKGSHWWRTTEGRWVLAPKVCKECLCHPSTTVVWSTVPWVAEVLWHLGNNSWTGAPRKKVTERYVWTHFMTLLMLRIIVTPQDEKQWKSNLSACSLVPWWTYHRNETLI